MRDLSFSWDVELSERGSASLGGRRPLATLVICSESHGQERIPIPKAVGRRLPSVADEVVARFVEVGLLDDGRFAELFARSKAAAGWGRIKIERELARRGVDATQLEGWPSDYLEEDESETAFVLASRRRLSGKNDFQKLVRFLCGRGFPMGVAMDAAKRVLAEAEQG